MVKKSYKVQIWSGTKWIPTFFGKKKNPTSEAEAIRWARRARKQGRISRILLNNRPRRFKLK